MNKNIIDELTKFVSESEITDEIELFNEFTQENNLCPSFDDAKRLVEIIRRLTKVDKRILNYTVNYSERR